MGVEGSVCSDMQSRHHTLVPIHFGGGGGGGEEEEVVGCVCITLVC